MNADFAQTRGIGSPFSQGRVEAFHIGTQFGLGRVVPTDLTNLPPYGDGDLTRLQGAQISGQLGRQTHVEGLLCFHRGLGDVHQGGSIHIDVEETRLDCLGDEIAHCLQFSLGILSITPRGNLKMIPLQEDRAPPTLGDGCSENLRRVFGRALIGIANFRAGDLKDKGSRPHFLRYTKHSAGSVKRQHPQIQRRHSEHRRHLTPPAGHIQPVDRGRINAQRLGRLAQQPLRTALLLRRAQRRLTRQGGHAPPQRRLIHHLDAGPFQPHRAVYLSQQARPKIHATLLIAGWPHYSTPSPCAAHQPPQGKGIMKKQPSPGCSEPPTGLEPVTHRLRGGCSTD